MTSYGDVLRTSSGRNFAGWANAGYYSNISTNRKKDGIYRIFLNLKKISIKTAPLSILKWNL